MQELTSEDGGAGKLVQGPISEPGIGRGKYAELKHAPRVSCKSSSITL